MPVIASSAESGSIPAAAAGLAFMRGLRTCSFASPALGHPIAPSTRY